MKLHRWEIVILVLILLCGAGLRLYYLGSAPLWVDESISAVASSAILDRGVPLLDSGVWYGRAYFFHYEQAFVLGLWHSDAALRLISVLFGLLTIVLGYFIGREYSKFGGVLTALFLAFFYLEVFYSRQGRFYQLFQLAFFLSLYLLYKSREKTWLLWPALGAFVIAFDTHLAGVVLAPFFAIHIFSHEKRSRWWKALFTLLPFLYYRTSSVSAVSKSIDSTLNYAGLISPYTRNIQYLLIFFIPGMIWAFMKRKYLTFLMIAPSLILLIGLFFVKTFAFRYAYFFAFPLALYASLLIAFLYERYGKIMLVPLAIILILQSNIFFPLTYVTLIKPSAATHNDASAPIIDYKNIPHSLSQELQRPETQLMTLFSPPVTWYIKKPQYVFPFSLDGRGTDQVSYNATDGSVVDIYSGALIRTTRPKGEFYFLADSFSLSKLKPEQKERFEVIVADCSIVYGGRDVMVYRCV